MILVLFAYCIAGGVYGEKIRKYTVRSLMQQPTIFSATPLSAQGSYGDECQACSSRVLQLSNSVEIFSRVASEREQEATSENKIFHPIIVWSEMLRSSLLAQAGIDDRAPFFSRWIRWTPPSFQWHNPVSAWLSLRVRASDYCWCPNIDCFLYICSYQDVDLQLFKPPPNALRPCCLQQ